LAHPALVTLARDLAALGPALIPLIAEGDRFLTLEWHGGGLSHPMLSGTDFWSISTGNVEIEGEPYVAAFPAPVEIGTRAQAAFDATGIPMRWHFADDALDLTLARRLPVLAPMVTYARDGTIELQTNDDDGSQARREPDLACWSGLLQDMPEALTPSFLRFLERAKRLRGAPVRGVSGLIPAAFADLSERN
jgi:hypothetical protein